MAKRTALRTADVPQADDLQTVRAVVKAAGSGGGVTAEIEQRTGYSDRHVRYRMQAARILGFVDVNRKVTGLGRRLLQTSPGGDAERQVFREAIEASPPIKALAPRLTRAEEPDVASLCLHLQAHAGLSPATAERRARVLRSWWRQTTQP